MKDKRLKLHVTFIFTVFVLMLGTSYILSYKIEKTLPKITIPDPRELFPEKITFTGTLVNDKDDQPLPGFEFKFKIGDNILAQAESDEAGYFELVISVRNNITYKNFKNIANGNFTIRVATGDTNVFVYSPNKKFFNFREIFKKGSIDSNSGTKFVLNWGESSASSMVGSYLVAQAQNTNPNWSPMLDKNFSVGTLFHDNVESDNVSLIVYFRNHPLSKTPMFDPDSNIDQNNVKRFESKIKEKFTNLQRIEITSNSVKSDSIYAYGRLKYKGGFVYEKNSNGKEIFPSSVKKYDDVYNYSIDKYTKNSSNMVSLVAYLGNLKVTTGEINFEFIYNAKYEPFKTTLSLFNSTYCGVSSDMSKLGFNFNLTSYRTCVIELDLGSKIKKSSGSNIVHWNNFGRNSEEAWMYDFSLKAQFKVSPSFLYRKSSDKALIKNSVLCFQLKDINRKEKTASYLFKKNNGEDKFYAVPDVNANVTYDKNNYFFIEPRDYLIESYTDKYDCDKTNGVTYLPTQKHNIVSLKKGAYKTIFPKFSVNSLTIAKFKFKFDKSLPGVSRVLKEKGLVELDINVEPKNHLLKIISAKRNRFKINENPVVTTNNLFAYFDNSSYSLENADNNIPELKLTFLTNTGLYAKTTIKPKITAEKKMDLTYTDDTLLFKPLLEPVPIRLSKRGDGKIEVITACFSYDKSECDKDELFKVCNDFTDCEKYVNQVIKYSALNLNESSLSNFEKKIYTLFKKNPSKSIKVKFFTSVLTEDGWYFPGRSDWAEITLRGVMPFTEVNGIDLNDVGINLNIDVMSMTPIKPKNYQLSSENDFTGFEMTEGSFSDFGRKPFDSLTCGGLPSNMKFKFFPKKINGKIDIAKFGCFNSRDPGNDKFTYDEFIKREVKVEYESYGFIKTNVDANAPALNTDQLAATLRKPLSAGGAYIADLDTSPIKIYNDNFKFRVTYSCTPLACKLDKLVLVGEGKEKQINDPKEFMRHDLVLINKKYTGAINSLVSKPSFAWADAAHPGTGYPEYQLNGGFHAGLYLATRYKAGYMGKAFAKNIVFRKTGEKYKWDPIFKSTIAGIEVSKLAGDSDTQNLCALEKTYGLSKEEAQKKYAEQHSVKALDQFVPLIKKAGITRFQLSSTVRGGYRPGNHCSGGAYDVVFLWNPKEPMRNDFAGYGTLAEPPLAKKLFTELHKNKDSIHFTLGPWRMDENCWAGRGDKAAGIQDVRAEDKEDGVCKNYSNMQKTDKDLFKKYANNMMREHSDHFHINTKAVGKASKTSMYCKEKFLDNLDANTKISETERKNKEKLLNKFQKALADCSKRK